jgi:Zn-dependent protease with chaperone function
MRAVKNRASVLFLGLLAIAACAAPAQQPPAQQPGYVQPGQPSQQGYVYPQQPGYAPQGTPQQPVPPQVAQQAQQTRPMLEPLTQPMFQPEARAVLAELITRLPANYMNLVNGMPLQIDPDPTQVNAYATCTDSGSPYIAVTEGLLEAVDAIAQTRSTDELFGTQTYTTYTNAVLPGLLQPNGRAALPQGIIPAQYLNLPQRLSRAHEMWDDIIAFTVGHEISHHYLGHTGCKGTVGAIDLLGGWRALTQIVQPVNQINETAADSFGVTNVLNTGLARAPNYRWSEKGGLMLLDFFSRLEQAAGLTPGNPIGYLQSHPNSPSRVSEVLLVANTWYAQHPGVAR